MLEIPKITNKKLRGRVSLPPSKSISNRWLIIRALAGSEIQFDNLSDSNDTLVLKKAIEDDRSDKDFEDAGTPLRLYLAYAALKGLNVRISGNHRLSSRPLAPLLQALEQLGAEFMYEKENHALPLQVMKGLDSSCKEVTIDTSLSSQFLSALLLIAPYFKHGLKIIVTGSSVSAPYISLTLHAMKMAGVKTEIEKNIYRIPFQAYHLQEPVYIESDWSSAAFVYALAANAEEVDIVLENLGLDSSQGDSAAAAIFNDLGVSSRQEERNIRLSKSGSVKTCITLDFTDIPDMFPAVAAACAGLKIYTYFTGIENLTWKESDRVDAMAQNLHQTGAIFRRSGKNTIELEYERAPDISVFTFKSFDDHRIAMACSLFAFYGHIVVDNEQVVRKSFPNYWKNFFDLISH